MRPTMFMLLLLCFQGIQADAQAPIGNWTDHLSYQHCFRIAESGPRVFASTNNAVFSFDVRDQSIERLSKFSSLSETGVAAIAAEGDYLVIGYNNGNIDILEKEVVTNLNAIKTSQTLNDKRIFDIIILQERAYVCTAFGIVVIDLSVKDIVDTYFIGATGGRVAVYSLSQTSAHWFAATSEGVKFAAVNGANLQDYTNWQTTNPNAAALVNQDAQILAVHDTVFYRSADTIFRYNAQNFHPIYISSIHINEVRVSGNRLISLERNATYGRAMQISSNGTAEALVRENATTTNPVDILEKDSELFIADADHGLIRYASGAFQSLNPSSPLSDSITGLYSFSNATWTGSSNPLSLSSLNSNNWSNIQSPLLENTSSLTTFARDQASGKLFAGSANNGLFEIGTDGTITRYRENSFIFPSASRPSEYPVTGLATDASNNLWISNGDANRPLTARSSGGATFNFSAPFPTLGELLIDDIDQKWIIAPGTGLLCFNSGPDPSNPADDQWKIFQAGAGAGNLPTNTVLSIAKDRNNFIWVGTSSGIGIIQCPELVFTNQACEAVLPVVQQGNFNGYLFRGEQVQAIAVDGADRKWIGTTKGAWLLSPDGATTIRRFTTDNSPLPSDDIRKISIDPSTGDVYFGTPNGLCSFRGDATVAGVTPSKALVFPNPVPPGYTGTIAIRGLPANSTVKIVELNGRLVHQARTNGGQFTWNGFNYLGQRASSGIYLVLIIGEDRKENLATKIIILSK